VSCKRARVAAAVLEPRSDRAIVRACSVAERTARRCSRSVLIRYSPCSVLVARDA
jgi:hypothetical protein